MCLISIETVQEIFKEIVLSKVFKFLFIGGSLYILSALLLYVFENKLDMQSKKAYLIQTVITYTLQFTFNALWTWSDPEATLIENLLKVIRFIPTKIIIWYFNQWVFAVYKKVVRNSQLANMLSVASMMFINYFIFDMFVFKQAD